MIVLAFTPSESLKDWQFTWHDGRPCYEQRTRFYCTGCKELSTGYCADHATEGKRDQFYDLQAAKIVEAPRIYVDRGVIPIREASE